ncbi:MAG TPA: hypothetical protein PKG48_05925 [Bacteroidales bacterium]|nr:hypothetical protein [Bacteroidales bacterium]
MARQEINLGIVPGDKRGDKLRVGGKKINENFTELYNSLTNQQTSPVIAGYHLITYEECNQLAGIHVIIPAPGVGKLVEIVSMIARITPMAPPVGGLQIYSTQTLNVTTDGDTETRDWGFFPADFIMSQSQTIQRMTPVFRLSYLQTLRYMSAFQVGRTRNQAVHRSSFIICTGSLMQQVPEEPVAVEQRSIRWFSPSSTRVR